MKRRRRRCATFQGCRGKAVGQRCRCAPRPPQAKAGGLTKRWRRTPSGRAPRGAVGNHAPRGALPLGAAHLHVMHHIAEMQVCWEATVVAGRPRPSSASCAARAGRARLVPASRTRAEDGAALVQASSRAERPDLALGSAVRIQACLSARTAPRSHRGASPERSASFMRPRPLALPWHNRSVETDTQRQGATRRSGKSCTSRRPAAGCRSPSR